MMSFKKRYKTRKKAPIIYSIIVTIWILFLTIGFSTFTNNLNINSIATVRVQKDIRVTNISMSNSTSGAYSNWEEYNVHYFEASAALPNSDSTITYDIEIKNIGNTEMGISSITGLPDNLTYSISNYNLNDTLCDDTTSTRCKLGTTTTLHITIGYAPNGYDSSNITYILGMDFDFKEVYSITYIGFSSVENLPTKIMDGETKTITFNNTTGIPAEVTTNNATANYTNPTLTISNATDNVVITRLFSITYINFPGDTSELASTIGPEGGTINFNSTTGTPELVTVTGATNTYNSSTHVLTLTNVTSNVTITMENDGIVEITSITKQDILNITENNPPQITNNGQGITFDLGVTVEESNYEERFYVTYAIVINNDSVHEQKILATNFTPTIIGTGNQPNVTYKITDANENIVQNATIAPKVTQTYYLTIEIEPQEQGSWGVEGESNVNIVENGTVSGSITNSTQGDLTGSNTTAHFTAQINNSYNETKNVILSIDDNKFRIVDSNGNAIQSMNISANTISTYDFYIKNMNGNNFISSPYELNININYDDNTNSIGTVSLQVDIDPTLTDHTAPTINSVEATITSTEKEILVSWTGSDDNTIKNYYVETYSSDAAGNGTLIHTETLNGAANGARVTYTATVPTDNAYYYFKVYAKDQSDNIASSNDITSCSTGAGHCSRTTNEIYKWNFIVTLVLTNATSSEGTTSTSNNVRTVTINATYDSNINTTLSGVTNYDPPKSISKATITYANGTSNTLESGNSSQTAYNYNTNNHVLNIYHITGDIRIEAAGEYNNPGCLVEGTKILLANGTYKNVEDIKYDDLLAVWNYDTGELTSEYPLWIEKEAISNDLIRVTFSDNSFIDFVGNHGIYDTDKNTFVNITDEKEFKIGTNVAKLKNNKLTKITVKNIEKINKEVKYYFIGSTTYYNIFANDILTTDRNLMISNLYGFEANAKWPEEKKQILANEKNLLDYSYFEDVLPYYLYKGFRVREAGFLVNNSGMDLNVFKNYITTLIINQNVIESPITKNNNRYWMVTTSLDKVNNSNKESFLKKEGSTYKLPKVNKQNFKGWYNTSENKIYYPGEKYIVNHGTHFSALYEENKFSRLYTHLNISLNYFNKKN